MENDLLLMSFLCGAVGGLAVILLDEIITRIRQ